MCSSVPVPSLLWFAPALSSDWRRKLWEGDIINESFCSVQKFQSSDILSGFIIQALGKYSDSWILKYETEILKKVTNADRQPTAWTCKYSTTTPPVPGAPLPSHYGYVEKKKATSVLFPAFSRKESVQSTLKSRVATINQLVKHKKN